MERASSMGVILDNYAISINMLTEMELARQNLQAKVHIMNKVQNESEEDAVNEGNSDSDVDSSDIDDVLLSTPHETDELAMIPSRRERKAPKRLSLSGRKQKPKRTNKGVPCTYEMKGGEYREPLYLPINLFLIKK
jgi:hypothetical protein